MEPLPCRQIIAHATRQLACTEAELAKMLGVGHTTIYRWKRRGEMPEDAIVRLTRLAALDSSVFRARAKRAAKPGSFQHAREVLLCTTGELYDCLGLSTDAARAWRHAGVLAPLPAQILAGLYEKAGGGLWGTPGKLVSALQEVAGCTQKQIGKLVGATQSQVCAWKAGSEKMPFAVRDRLLEALRVAQVFAKAPRRAKGSALTEGARARRDPVSRACARLSCTQKELAASIGIHHATITAWRNGQRVPSYGLQAMRELSRRKMRRLAQPQPSDSRELVARALRRRNWSGAALARALGVSNATVSDWKRNSRRINPACRDELVTLGKN